MTVVDRREFLTTVTATATTSLIAGCTGGGGGGNGGNGMQTTTTTAEDGGDSMATVLMVNTSFDPVRLSVAPGTTVKWINKDSFPHDVVSAQFHPDVAAEWSMDVKVAAGESTTHTFQSKGIYEYYCEIHGKQTMCGVVLVGDVSLEKKLPCESDGGGGGGY